VTRGFARAVAALALALAGAATGALAGARGGQTHTVTVGNNFFSPVDLVVEVGDTVRWTNVTGIHHNVVACETGQLGCGGEVADEFFDSGPPDTFWVYAHTFKSPGSNPYICQPHATHMAGRITVLAPPAAPPPVPDGTAGDAVLVERLDADGVALAVSWDATSCAGASDFFIVHGGTSDLPSAPGGAFTLAGAVCALGAPPFVWDPAPPAAPGELVWWLVLASDGAATEGSWGSDSAGAERLGPGAAGESGLCGHAMKSLGPCQPAP
jgi:plastocyanin